MNFQALGIDFRMQNRIKINWKFVSMMACLNATTFCQENQTQDASKTPQDGPRYPKTAQDALRGAWNSPKTPQREPKTRPGRLPRRFQNALRSTQDAARHTQNAPRHDQDAPIGSKSRPGLLQTSILDHFGDDFEPFLEDFWRILGAVLNRFLAWVFSHVVSKFEWCLIKFPTNQKTKRGGGIAALLRIG